MLYIPRQKSKKKWGTVSGSRVFYEERNREIKRLYREGCSMEALAQQYGLAYTKIRKIIYGWTMNRHLHSAGRSRLGEAGRCQCSRSSPYLY